jgi:flagellum-specific peptidoglycan hydrolase FlgJ
MQKLSRVMVAASAAALVFLPAGIALAQGAPGGGTAPPATSTAAPEAKAPENKAPENKAPENKASENTAPEKEKAAPKKKKPARMTRQQEIDRSIDRGTVPARYRNSVPKEYHQFIPFDKR